MNEVKKCTTCPNTVFGKWKTCLACRLYKKADNARRREMRRKKEHRTTDKPVREPWTQARWVKFVREGGLEGL